MYSYIHIFSLFDDDNHYQMNSFQHHQNLHYSHLMDRILKDQFSRKMEVYVDDMVVKFDEAESYAYDLE